MFTSGASACLQAYLFDIISDEARRQDNLAILDRFAHGAYHARLTQGEVTGTLQAARAERDAELPIPPGASG